MRISDWSSDVCSSDLRVARAGAALEQQDRAIAGRSQVRGLGICIAQVYVQRQARAIVHAPVRGDCERTQYLGCLGARARQPRQCRQLFGLRKIELQRIGRCRSEEHTSELQSLMRISYAVFCLKKKKKLKAIIP